MILNDKVYDILKWMAQLVLPAAATLYTAVAMIWVLPGIEPVVGTLMALSAFIGAILGVSNMQYNLAKTTSGDVVLSDRPNDVVEDVPDPYLIFSKETYELLKWLAVFVLPAVGTFYVTLSTMWGFPYGGQVGASIVAITTFIGAILGYSSSKLKSGS